MGKPHKHAEVIKAAAEGKTIQYRDDPISLWKDYTPDNAFRFLGWYGEGEYRIKPEPVYPVTRMTTQEIKEIYDPADTVSGGCLDVANAAIRRAIQDGDVILPNKD